MSEAPPDPRPGVLRTPEARFADIADYPWEPHYLEVEPGLRMAYVDAGPADATETVLLLHGEPTWGYLYRKMIPPLVEAGHRVIVPDLIGFGRSDKPTDPEAYTYTSHTRWVRALLDALDLGGITFFGQDWGGLIGGRVVGQDPDRFARLVFSNTGMPRSGPGLPGIAPQERLPPEMLEALLGIAWRDTVDDEDRIDPDAVHALVDQGGVLYFLAWRVYAQEVAELWPSKVVPGWCLSDLSDDVLAAYDAPFPTQDFVVGARRFPLLVPVTEDDPERLVNDEVWQVLEAFDRPVLTIWGDHCPHTYLTMGEDLRANIPGAQRPGIDHRVYEASHFIQEDRGEEVAADIVALIDQHPT
ncbi:MAG: haloalkane dehalogenase [Acidimicrobiales bacterium]|nr:haloalkane dehalogenase [Acidimicrobiales bacterium]